MATPSEHIDRGHHNETLATQMPGGFADWRIAITFYAALHYVEAIIIRSGRRSSDHKSRKEAMRTLPALRLAAVDYDTLANQAWIARYRADYDFNDPALSAEVQRICDLLPAIKNAIGMTP